jgi:2-polyprenyl-3-methyl-5-hydroxy-6-metoxy-1,4-benzoquinol methylase
MLIYSFQKKDMTEEIMANFDDKQILELWDHKARDWDIQVGDDGDSNRILNSDPVLWSFAGNVAGLSVLDAGCGTGYLARQLCLKGASVTAVDFSPQMIEIAQFRANQNNLNIDFNLDSCTELKSLPDEQFDMIISNYVLMDLLDFEEAIKAFNRVLKPSGIAIIVFSHPCFPQGSSTTVNEDGTVFYGWDSSYFERTQRNDRPYSVVFKLLKV